MKGRNKKANERDNIVERLVNDYIDATTSGQDVDVDELLSRCTSEEEKKELVSLLDVFRLGKAAARSSIPEVDVDAAKERSKHRLLDTIHKKKTKPSESC